MRENKISRLHTGVSLRRPFCGAPDLLRTTRTCTSYIPGYNAGKFTNKIASTCTRFAPSIRSWLSSARRLGGQDGDNEQRRVEHTGQILGKAPLRTSTLPHLSPPLLAACPLSVGHPQSGSKTRISVGGLPTGKIQALYPGAAFPPIPLGTPTGATPATTPPPSAPVFRSTGTPVPFGSGAGSVCTSSASPPPAGFQPSITVWHTLLIPRTLALSCSDSSLHLRAGGSLLPFQITYDTIAVAVATQKHPRFTSLYPSTAAASSVRGKRTGCPRGDTIPE